MSCNSMMQGFAIKTDKVNLTDEESDELIENFDMSKLNEWQLMYDESGIMCFVFLIDSDYEFYDDMSTSIKVTDFYNKVNDVIRSFNVDGVALSGELIFFTKIWYNGTDMGSLFDAK